MTQKNKVTRVARILVEVDQNWLYGDDPADMDNSAIEGWEEIVGALLALRSDYSSLKGRVSASHIEWEPDEDPAEEVARIPAAQTNEAW